MPKQFELFDSHLHIINPDFPLVPNNGYLPDRFDSNDYLASVSKYNLVGGAVVSGSFQAFDQGYLVAALNSLGPGFVGVTQLPHTTPDEEIVRLSDSGVRALRFNLYRGGSEPVDRLESMARRVYELVGWHTELYVDSKDLGDLASTLLSLPAVSIDHLGISQSGFSQLVQLVEKGVKVKATGFGRVDFDVSSAISALYSANPDALMFGTDLPSTRAPVPFRDSDFNLVAETLGSEAAEKVFCRNALSFYKPAG